MISKKYEIIISNIIQEHSKEEQVLQTIEELAELQKELIKNVNRGKDNIKEIILEIADVVIMITQLIQIYDIDKEKLQGAIEYKLLRQEKRLKDV